MLQTRLIVLVWLASAVTCVLWPIFFTTQRDWPLEALTYARWVEYQSSPLAFSNQAKLIGAVLLLGGASLVFWRIRRGAVPFAAGLLLHGYSSFDLLPTIAASTTLAVFAFFYVVSGLVIGISLSSHAPPLPSAG